jgi:hypothetical protein
MAGATNKSAKRYGYTAKQMATVRATDGVVSSLHSMMASTPPARPTKAFHAAMAERGRSLAVERMRAVKARALSPERLDARLNTAIVSRDRLARSAKRNLREATATGNVASTMAARAAQDRNPARRKKTERLVQNMRNIAERSGALADKRGNAAVDRNNTAARYARAKMRAEASK